MRFEYYNRLSRSDQAIYRKSDAIEPVEIQDAKPLRQAYAEVRSAYETEKTALVERSMSNLCVLVCDALGVERIDVRVKARRPSSGGEELYGIYEREEGSRPVLTLWMRTAKQRKVVSFRTFFRTFVHELCHHVDFDKFGLAESFHTEGFFRRESALFRRLAPESDRKKKTNPNKLVF